MYKFSKRSQNALDSCHEDIKSIFGEVIKHRDCTIVWGFRDRDQQGDLFRRGLSQKKWPHSDHNKTPSRAVDAYPYINKAVSFDREQCINFAGFVQGIAAIQGIALGWGGDWDRDHNLAEHKLSDLGHFYLLRE